MGALSADRNTPRRDDVLFVYPMEAATKCFAGGLAALNAAGNAVPASANIALKVVGRFEAAVDNSAGLAGDKRVEVRRGLFQFGNSAGGDEITLADVGKPCFVVDDQTVAKTSASGTRPAAGMILDVDAQGVWVGLGILVEASSLRTLIGANKVHLAISVADLRVASGLVERFVSPVAGTITKLYSVLNGALATGDATLTPSIGGVDVTDGALTIAQADSAAGDVDSAVPSAANAVTAGQAVALTVGGTNTANVSAMVMVEITF